MRLNTIRPLSDTPQRFIYNNHRIVIDRFRAYFTDHSTKGPRDGRRVERL